MPDAEPDHFRKAHNSAARFPAPGKKPAPPAGAAGRPTPEEDRQKRLREEATSEPAVQEALDLFGGRVVDVREAKASREDA